MAPVVCISADKFGVFTRRECVVCCGRGGPLGNATRCCNVCVHCRAHRAGYPARDSGALQVLPRGAYNTTTVTAYRRQQRPQRQATRHHNSTVTTTQKGRARTPDYAHYRSPRTAQPHRNVGYFAGLHGSLPYVERLRLTQCEPCLLGCAKMARALRAPCAFSWPSIA